jgi:UDP-N-acetylmuramate dehydrogenase
MKIRENALISQLTTMRLGAAAHYLIEIEEEADLEPAYAFAREKGLPTYILGDGSNVIGRDEGFAGVVMLNRLKGFEVLSENSDELIVRAASGEELDDFVSYSVADDWYGAEALAAIPGTIGGAVMQNAGAYGQEMAQILAGVDVFCIRTGESSYIPVENLDLCYRQSIFNSKGSNSAKGRYFIVAAHLRLHKNEIQGDLYGSLQAYLTKHELSDRRAKTIRDAVSTIRGEKLPDSALTASSGSFFKNITIDEVDIEPLRERYPGIPIFMIGNCWEVASGWLIEQAGLKGKLLHGMRVSDKAALILINESAGGYGDLCQARDEIRSAVKEKFGFDLEQEPEEI